MLKILVKAAILVFIILSIYFIVNPSACSNLMLGRVVNSTDKEPAVAQEGGDHGELFVPAGDRGVRPQRDVQETATQETPAQETPAQESAEQPAQPTGGAETAVVTDTRSATEPEATQTPGYSQEDIDYAIASRYVELENEYAQKNKLTKDSAKEISYQVMDDFELTPQEWESFLQRATQTNLFNQIRTEMKAK